MKEVDYSSANLALTITWERRSYGLPVLDIPSRNGLHIA